MKIQDDAYDMTEPTEEEWFRFAMAGGAFDDLADPREDIYTLEDGEPFVAEERYCPVTRQLTGARSACRQRRLQRRPTG